MTQSWQKVLALSIAFPSSLVGTGVLFFGLAKEKVISNGLALGLFVLVALNFIWLLINYAKRR